VMLGMPGVEASPPNSETGGGALPQGAPFPSPLRRARGSSVGAFSAGSPQGPKRSPLVWRRGSPRVQNPISIGVPPCLPARTVFVCQQNGSRMRQSGSTHPMNE
jgi:hypothetical protein